MISITDGQIYLDTDMFNSNKRPAINAGLSVSRVGGAAQTSIVKKLGGSVRLALAQFHELEAFAQFASDMDASTQQLLARGSRLVELLKQPQYSPLPMEEQVVSIYAGVNGYLDAIDVNKISRFENDLMNLIKGSYKDILKSIRDEQSLSDKTEEKLKKAIEEFMKTFE